MKIPCKVKDKRRILPMVLRMWENQMHFLCVLVMKRRPSFWSVNFIELFIAFRVENQNKKGRQSCCYSGHQILSFPAYFFSDFKNLCICLVFGILWNIIILYSVMVQRMAFLSLSIFLSGEKKHGRNCTLMITF